MDSAHFAASNAIDTLLQSDVHSDVFYTVLQFRSDQPFVLSVGSIIAEHFIAEACSSAYPLGLLFLCCWS